MKVTVEKFEECFLIQGRRYAESGRLFLNHSGGSLKGLFRGERLAFDLASDFEIQGRNAYIRITVDGRTRRLRLPKGKKRIEMTLPFGEHAFEIVKLTESTNNTLEILSVETEGAFLSPERKTERKIEFIGDSITTGFGVLCRSEMGEYKTKEQDVTKAFPYLVAKALGASYHTVAAGGWPIYRSKFSDHAIPEVYDNVDFFRKPEKWDFSLYKPDAIVVTLGTNDYFYLSELSSEKKGAEREEVKRHLIRFLRRLLEQNTPILLVYGFFVYPDLGVLTEEVVKEMGSPLLSTVEVRSARSLSDVCAGHPGKRTHALAAAKIASRLEEILVGTRGN